LSAIALPKYFAGGHNFHGKWICSCESIKAVEVLKKNSRRNWSEVAIKIIYWNPSKATHIWDKKTTVG
jgi:hypothetical protein